MPSVHWRSSLEFLGFATASLADGGVIAPRNPVIPGVTHRPRTEEIFSGAMQLSNLEKVLARVAQSQIEKSPEVTQENSQQ